jgi:hypothetical protein
MSLISAGSISLDSAFKENSRIRIGTRRTNADPKHSVRFPFPGIKITGSNPPRDSVGVLFF